MVRDETSSAPAPTPEGLLARGEVDAWVLRLPAEGETIVFRRLDWRFRGALSRALAAGGLSRDPGAVSLLPFTRAVPDAGERTFRVLSVGAKSSSGPVPAQELAGLIRNISGLGLKRVGLSASDFGWTEAEAKRNFSALKGVETCVTK